MKSFKYDFQNQILNELNAKQQVRIGALMGDEFKVLDDEAEATLTDSGRMETEALNKLQEWREKSK